MDDAQAVLEAAATIVEAFAANRTEAYFDCFAPGATFVFHTTSEPLSSRAAYEELWATWQREDGFRVVSCASSDQQVQMLGETAVFTHRVRTVVASREGEDALDERETIVFTRGLDGRWLAVHEHLSPAPH